MTTTIRIRRLATGLLLAAALGGALAEPAAATHVYPSYGAHPNTERAHHYVPNSGLGRHVHIGPNGHV